ncbi:hypothetical protein TKK_0018785 [Trichogramma kaykai]
MDMIQYMLEADPNKPIFGVMYASPLMNLPNFDLVQRFIPDYMHCCLEGVSAQMLDYYLNSLSKDDINFMDQHMIDIAAPNQLARLTRKITERNDWKAREWENFTLYYSVPLLSTKISRQKLNHWLLYVEALYIVTQDSISEFDLNKANQLFRQFVRDIDELPGGDLLMTFNVHLLLHICESVLNWGPVTINSAFPFESANHHILNAIKCAKGAPQQVFRFVNINHYILFLEKKVSRVANDDVLNFCNNTLSSKVHNAYKSEICTYFGKGDYFDSQLFPSENLSDNTLKYNKMVEDRCIFESGHKVKKRSDNSYALLDDGRYVKIDGFVVDHSSGNELTICQLIKVKSSKFVSYKMFKILDHIYNDKITVPTEKIKKICIIVNNDVHTYICALATMLHY